MQENVQFAIGCFGTVEGCAGGRSYRRLPDTFGGGRGPRSVIHHGPGSEHPGNPNQAVAGFGSEFERDPIGEAVPRFVGAQRAGGRGGAGTGRRVAILAFREADDLQRISAEHLAGCLEHPRLRGAFGRRKRRELGNPLKFRFGFAHFLILRNTPAGAVRLHRIFGAPSIVGGVRNAVFRRGAARISTTLWIIGCLSCGGSAGEGPATDERAESFAFPAEFEPHRALWMAWPTYENKRGLPTEPLLIEIIRAAEGRVSIELLAQDEEEAGAIRDRFTREAVPDDHVTIHRVPHGDIWMRDMGPIFLRGDRGGLRVADFGFNMWGYEPPESANSRLEEAVDRHVADFFDLEIVKSPLISEGGSREFNGRGVMMAVEAVEQQRNPGWTLEAMEDEFRRVLGVTQVIWLAEGMAEDELTFKGRLPGDVYTVITTGGHVDEFARFADARTILLAEVTEEESRADPIAAISYERLEESYRRLSAATDQDGNPFRIVRVPVPDSLFETMRRGDGVFDYIQPLDYEDGSRIEPDDEIRVVAAASYLNFQVTNELVLAQKYWKPGMAESLREKDELALGILREEFPGREVLALDAMAVNLGGGGIHCILQQEPRRAARPPSGSRTEP